MSHKDKQKTNDKNKPIHKETKNNIEMLLNNKDYHKIIKSLNNHIDPTIFKKERKNERKALTSEHKIFYKNNKHVENNIHIKNITKPLIPKELNDIFNNNK